MPARSFLAAGDLDQAAGWFSEGKLIGYAFAFEQATRHRKPPRYLPTIELT